MKGGVSGGTVASLKGTVDAVKKDRSLAKVLADPYALSPDRGQEPDPQQDAQTRPSGCERGDDDRAAEGMTARPRRVERDEMDTVAIQRRAAHGVAEDELDPHRG